MLDFGRIDPNEELPDTAETLRISALALLKMLRHGRAGVPMEVMGMILGKYVDDYTIDVVDVYAMPQRGTGVTVEAVDPVYQADMNEALLAVGRMENSVGWYHSHPGFGCWLSNVDCSTQQTFEQLNKRAVAIVIDPIQSVKGKVVIDAFRLINSQMSIIGMAPRQINSNLGFENKPSLVSVLHGLNRNYYGLRIDYKRSDLEMRMLKNVDKRSWADILTPKLIKENIEKESKDYIREGDERMIGKIDYRRRLLEKSEDICIDGIISNLLMGIHGYIFG